MRKETSLNACVINVTIPTKTPENAGTWGYEGPFWNGKAFEFPLEIQWIVFVLEGETAKNFAFLTPEGVSEKGQERDNWVIQSWSAGAVVVKDCQVVLFKTSGTFILWVETISTPGTFYSGGPEVINTGNPEDVGG